METQGLVARRRDAADERQVRVSLTERGLALREAVLATDNPSSAAAVVRRRISPH